MAARVDAGGGTGCARHRRERRLRSFFVWIRRTVTRLPCCTAEADPHGPGDGCSLGVVVDVPVVLVQTLQPVTPVIDKGRQLSPQTVEVLQCENQRV